MLSLLLGIMLVPCVNGIAQLFLRLCCHIIDTEADEQVHKMDKILAAHAFIGSSTPNRKRAPGYHLMWYQGSLVVANKTRYKQPRGGNEDTYTIYILGFKSSFQCLCQQLTLDTSKVITVYTETVCPWDPTIVTFNDRRDLTPNPRQQEIMDLALKHYTSKGLSFLMVAGKPGVGKTTLGELIGRQLCKKYQSPVRKATVNLAQPGEKVAEFFQQRSHDEILILEMSEYDFVIKTAMGERTNTNTELTCHASTKSALNDFFDFLGKQNRLVVIATTNQLDIFDIEKYKSFTRRFDEKVQW